MARNTKTTSVRRPITMTEVLKPYLNVKVNYEQAKKITGKTDSAFNSKISRCGLKPTKERLYLYIDMLKIKHKKV